MLESLQKNRERLPQQAAEQIMKLVQERQLKGGEKIPNEFELMEWLSVGRGTVREAVKILVSRNVLEIRRGKGTYVCKHPGIVDDPLGFAFVKDRKQFALDLCEVRMMLEPEIAALAAVRATDEEIEKIQKAADEVAVLCRKGEEHMEKDIAFHELIAKCSKNAVMPRLIPVIQSGVAAFIQVTDRALAMDTIRTHQLVVDAIKERSPQQARAAMEEHLRMNKEMIEDMLSA